VQIDQREGVHSEAGPTLLNRAANAVAGEIVRLRERIHLSSDQHAFRDTAEALEGAADAQIARAAAVFIGGVNECEALLDGGHDRSRDGGLLVHLVTILGGEAAQCTRTSAKHGHGPAGCSHFSKIH